MSRPICQVCGEGMDLPAAARPDRSPGPHESRECVYCAECGTVHHRECFEYNRGCSTYACGGLRYSRQGKGGRDVEVIAIRLDARDLDERMLSDHRLGSFMRDMERIRVSLGVASSPPAPGPSPGLSVPRPPVGTQTRLVGRRLILDIDTLSEDVVKVVLVLAGGACLAWLAYWLRLNAEGASSRAPMDWGAGSLLALIVALVMYRSTDCYMVVDAGSREVYYHRKIVGWTRLIPRIVFDRVQAVQLEARERFRSGVDREPGHYYEECTLWALDDAGVRHLLMGPTDSDRGNSLSQWPHDLEARGRDVAGIVGVRFDRVSARYNPWREWVTYEWLGAWALITAAALAAAVNLSDGSPAALAAANVCALIALWVLMKKIPTGS